MKIKSFLFLLTIFTFACTDPTPTTDTTPESVNEARSPMQQKLGKYVPFKLTTDLSVLSDNQKKMIPLLIEAADIMHDLFWYESYGDKDQLMS